MGTGWYVLRSKPNKEQFLWGQVLAHHVEIYYPSVKAQVVNPRARKMRPYFPGYLFVHVDLAQMPHSFWYWLPGSRGLVSFDEIPAVVPDALIIAIRRKVDEINASGGEQFVRLKPGDPVIVQSGPFSDYTGIFDGCVSGNDRVRVLLNHLRGRQTPVILPAEQVALKK